MFPGGQPVFDLHSDIPVDISRRRAQGETRVFERIHAPRLQSNGVAAIIIAIWVEAEYRQHSFERFIQLLGALMADVAESPDCAEWVTDEGELKKANAAGKIGLFLGVEGMTFVEQWPIFEDGLKLASGQDKDVLRMQEQLKQVMGLMLPLGWRQAIFAWGERNAIASGPGRLYRADMGAGFTVAGLDVARRLAESAVVLDISHLDDTSADDLFATVDGVIIASHSNARALCDVPRNLPDRHIREIAQRKGIIGLNAYPGFVDKDKPTLDKFLDHMSYLVEVAGVDSVGFGFDFLDYLSDYADEFSKVPEACPLQVEHLPRLLDAMSQRGFSDADIHKIAFANAARIFAHRG